MREKFREFYFDRDNEKIWQDSIIVLDTNVLLNLYRFTKETSDQILDLLQKYSEQLWIPHQVALEYHYNRKSVIIEQSGSYEQVCSAFNTVPNKVKDMLYKSLNSYKKRHKEDVEEFIGVIQKVSEEQVKKLNENIVEYDLNEYDSIKTKITELYSNKVGEPYDEKQMDNLEKEAEKRFKMKIPPGYKDLNKKNGHKFYNRTIIQDKYGDFILWKQLLDFADKNKTNIIFITDEQKEDWWYDLKSKVIGPKVELLNEFTSLTNKEFHMFTSRGFVDRHENDLNPGTVSEVREASREYEIIEGYADWSEDYADWSKEQLISAKRIIDNYGKSRDESFDEKALDSNTLSMFYRWFKDNQEMFRLDNYGFAKFYNILEEEFGANFTNKIMKFLYNENLVYLDKDKGYMMIKMNLLKSKVYLSLINKELHF